MNTSSPSHVPFTTTVCATLKSERPRLSLKSNHQMDDLMELVRRGDWRVVELRSQSRDPVLSALSESLVRDIDELRKRLE